jgi:anti-sigma factor (TIGR02949 family)
VAAYAPREQREEEGDVNPGDGTLMTRETTRMTCKDAIAVLADFLEETLSQETVRELEAHLRDCPPCRAYLNTYRKTRGLVARSGRAEMPAELKTRLRQFLLDQFTKPKR